MSERPICAVCGEPMPEAEEIFKFHGYIGLCPKSPMERPHEDTLQRFFERAEKKGVIDFHLRIVRSPEGLLDFYIHPQGRDGETGDFQVSASFVTKAPPGMGAGSSRRPAAPLL